jgi:hypothetical protein
MTQAHLDAVKIIHNQLEKLGYISKLLSRIPRMATDASNSSATNTNASKRQYDPPIIDLQKDPMIVQVSPTLIARINYYGARPSIDIGRYEPQFTDEELAQQEESGVRIAAKTAKRKFGTPMNADEYEQLISVETAEKIRERYRVAQTVGEKKSGSKREEMQRILRDNEKAREEKFLVEKRKAEQLAAAAAATDNDCDCAPAKKSASFDVHTDRIQQLDAQDMKRAQEAYQRSLASRTSGPMSSLPMHNGAYAGTSY